ncbi:MAG: imidazole glycerol phosphate synthase subunit HisH, partial [Dolichospermum sp.]
PFLGICLGMQLLTDCSEEGNLLGLGLIKGKAIRFQFNDKLLKIPHMGWNRIHLKNSSPLLFGMEEEQKFYFAHSYYVVCHHRENVIAQTSYGHDFDSIIQSGNVLGAQFLPERSHRYGMRLLKNFAMI